MTSTPDDADAPLRSRDEDPVGWGDERDEAAWSEGGRKPGGASQAEGADPDLERLLADRPPHHDRD